MFVTVLLVLFVMFNTQTVDISLVFADIEAPLVVALLVAAGLGGLSSRSPPCSVGRKAAADRPSHSARACPAPDLLRSYSPVIFLLLASRNRRRTARSTGAQRHEPLHRQPPGPRVQPLRVPGHQGPLRHGPVRADGRRDRARRARRDPPAGRGPGGRVLRRRRPQPAGLRPGDELRDAAGVVQEVGQGDRGRRVVPPRPARAPRRLRRPPRPDLGRLRDDPRRQPGRVHVRLRLRLRGDPRRAGHPGPEAPGEP